MDLKRTKTISLLRRSAVRGIKRNTPLGEEWTCDLLHNGIWKVLGRTDFSRECDTIPLFDSEKEALCFKRTLTKDCWGAFITGDAFLVVDSGSDG